MKHNSKFNSLLNNQWFDDIVSTICFLQDIVHIGTKLRNRLLKLVTVLMIGKKIASVAHLKILINKVPKDIHGIVYHDICPDDRQNYNSLKKVMQPIVREALVKNVPDSEATVEYIRICHEVTSSLYDDHLSPSERLSRIWRSTFFLRAWRLSVQRTNALNISDNFITQNTYQCIELNAKNLTILVKKFRDEGLSKHFIPTIFNSQPCEETFRKMRSMGTINFTKINFTLLELIHLIGRVELMDEIMHFKLADHDVYFPRNPVNKSNMNFFELPSDTEIQNIMLQSSNSAVDDAKKFGINITAKDIADCKIEDVSIVLNTNNQSKIDLGIAKSNEKYTQFDYTNFKDYTNRPDGECNSFVSLDEEHGGKVIRKSTLIWSISKSKEKLSSDRLQRVQKKKSCRRQLEFISVEMEDQLVYKVNEIKVGDWCIFDNITENSGSGTDFVLGNVLSFRYIRGKTKTEKQYSFDFAPFSHESNIRGIEVLASWYKFNTIEAELCHNSCSFISIERYVANLSDVTIEKNNNAIHISQHFTKSIQTELEKITKNK